MMLCCRAFSAFSFTAHWLKVVATLLNRSCGVCIQRVSVAVAGFGCDKGLYDEKIRLVFLQ